MTGSICAMLLVTIITHVPNNSLIFAHACESNLIIYYEFSVVHVTDQFQLQEKILWNVMGKFI